MPLFPEKMRQPVPTAAAWLDVVRRDPRMIGQTPALTMATALAPFIEPSGAGELPSLPDLAKLTKTSEDDAIAALNALIVRGFVALIFRPRIRFALPFFIRPSPYQGEAITKSAPAR